MALTHTLGQVNGLPGRLAGQLFEVVLEPDDRRVALGDILEREPQGYRTFLGNGGMWWCDDYRIVAGPNAGRRIQFGGFVDDTTGVTEPEWPPDWLRPVPVTR